MTIAIVERNCLSLSGKINFYNVTYLTQKAEALYILEPIERVDLHKVEQCDSAILLLLLHLWRLAVTQKRVLRLVNLPVKVKFLIKLSDLEEILT